MENEAKKPTSIHKAKFRAALSFPVHSIIHDSKIRMRHGDQSSVEYIHPQVSKSYTEDHLIGIAMKESMEAARSLIDWGELERVYDTGLVITSKKGKKYMIEIGIREIE